MKKKWDVHTDLYPGWIIAGMILISLSFVAKRWNGEEI